MVRACIIIREAIMKSFIGITTTAALLAAASAPAMAKEEAVALTKCDSSHGTIAIVDGDTQGWSEYGLGPPRELINSLAIDSGRSEERRVGKECVSTCRYRWSP